RLSSSVDTAPATDELPSLELQLLWSNRIRFLEDTVDQDVIVNDLEVRLLDWCRVSEKPSLLHLSDDSLVYVPESVSVFWKVPAEPLSTAFRDVIPDRVELVMLGDHPPIIKLLERYKPDLHEHSSTRSIISDRMTPIRTSS